MTSTLIEDLRQSCYCGGPVTQCLHCRCAEALGALSASPAPASGTTEEVERVALAIAQRIDLEHADLEHLHVPTTGIERDDFPDREFAPYLTLARAALAALREDGWRPIESAPEYETLLVVNILGNMIGYGPRTGCYTTIKGHRDWYDPYGGDKIYEPTHWRPLPAPPSSLKKAREDGE